MIFTAVNLLVGHLCIYAEMRISAADASRKHLFAAVDRAARWAHLEARASETAEEAQFLNNLTKKAPFVISRILTADGKEFTDQLPPVGQKPTGSHLCDQECAERGIEHHPGLDMRWQQFGTFRSES